MPYCTLCTRNFSDEIALHQHFSSYKHRKLLRSNSVISLDPAHPSGPSIQSPSNPRAIEIINPQTGLRAQGDKPSAYCSECRQQFHTESAFNRHRSSWIHTPKFYCKDCERLFPSQTKLNEHMESSHMPQFHCFDCEKIFFSQQTLNQHLGSPDHASLFCIHCGVRYLVRTQLENPVKSHHSTLCNKCERLTRNENAVNPELEPPRVEVFSNLLSFSLLHHGNTEDFPCYTCKPLCGRIFNTKKALETHIQFMVERLRLSVARSNKNTWSILPETPASIARLREMTHSKNVLVKNLYIMELPSDESINGQRKCKHCREKLFKVQGRSDTTCRFHPARGKKMWNETSKKLETYFSCCGKHERCVSLDEHIFEDFKALAQNLVYEETPLSSLHRPKRKAVALDCEMGTSTTNSCELIQLSVVDYFTGEVLIDSMVRPGVQMSHYNTPYSGITSQMMKSAIAEGEFLESFEGARAELWKWIDSETILVGHSLNHDLSQLRLVHPLIVDSYICVPKLMSSGNSLKTLAKQLLGKDVQEGLEGKIGHDCVEDALAARELVIWCSENKKVLEARAVLAKEEAETRRKEMEIRRKEKEELQVKKAEERLARLAALDTSEPSQPRNNPRAQR